MNTQTYTKRFTVAISLVMAAAVLYCSWPLGFILNPTSMRSGLASELGAFGQPYNWLFIWGDIISGALLVVACILLLRLWRPKRDVHLSLVLLLVYGVAGALDAALPEHCLPSLQTCGPIIHDPMLIMHGVFDYIQSVALLGTLVVAWRISKRAANGWLPWIYTIGVAGIIFALLSLVFMIINGPGYWTQRYYITISCIWVASIPFVLRPVVAARADQLMSRRRNPK